MSKEFDMLNDIFQRQRSLQERISKFDKTLIYPPENIDLSSKEGQYFLREMSFRMLEELCETFRHLKNKTHSQKENRTVNKEELYEELADVFTYMINICLFCGLDSEKLYEQYISKNLKNNKRIDEKY